MTISHRPASTSDRDFVIATWSASYKKAHTAGIIQADDWADIMRPQIVKILDRPGMRTLIAFERDDPTFLYGWIAGDTTTPDPVVAYLYVKQPYRLQGIARGLFAALGVDPRHRFTYGCKTGIVSELSSKIPFARFNNNDIRYSKRGL
jgi:GNAT superfamily N-acetyltransferase